VPPQQQQATMTQQAQLQQQWQMCCQNWDGICPLLGTHSHTSWNQPSQPQQQQAAPLLLLLLLPPLLHLQLLLL
jgi:hypothetical protein